MRVIADLEVSEPKSVRHQQKSVKRDHCRDLVSLYTKMVHESRVQAAERKIWRLD